MTSVSIPKVQPQLSDARSYLERITIAIDSYGAVDLSKGGTLSRLHTDLAAAISAYELANNAYAPYEVILMKQTDLLWQCNQCDHYLRHLAATSHNHSPKNRGLWQIRVAVLAIAHFKLLTYLRQLMPGANTTSLPWRDILPGFKLWLMRSNTHRR